MENAYVWVLGIACLLVGGVFGMMMFPTEVVKEVSVIELVEVEVPIETFVTVDTSTSYLTQALTDFVEEFLDEDDLVCNGDDYSVSEVTVDDIEDEWSVTFDEDETTVCFETELKFDEDDERSCRESYEVCVLYEEDEDTEFEYGQIRH